MSQKNHSRDSTGPPGGLSEGQQRFLRDLFPGAQALFGERARIYGTDAGRQHFAPWAVVRPVSAEQVEELLRWAQKERVPLFPRGRGTNVVGGCVPSGGGVVVSTLFLDSILELDEQDFLAVVQPGVLTARLQEEAGQLGLIYPPDPASAGISSLGGNAATNAGGMGAVKYGVTRDHVLGCEAVLPGGKRIRSGGRVHKDAVGLDLNSLLVGSEGTLGFITELTLRLLPRPEAKASLLAGFRDQSQGLLAAREVLCSGRLPAAMEFMDSEAVACLSSYGFTWLRDTGFLLLLTLDGPGSCLEAELEGVRGILSGFDPTTLQLARTPEEESSLWEARRALNPASFQLGTNKLSLDLTVPRGSVGRAVDAAQEAGKKQDIGVVTFGHLGDGNIHVNFLFEEERDREAGQRAVSELVDAVLELEGTVSGEHGVGLAKLPYVSRQLGTEKIRLMRGMKQVFDPYGILNPGKAY